MRRPVLVLVALLVALAGAVAAGALVAGREEVPEQVTVARVVAPVSYADSCPDLLAAYVDRAVDLVGPWGWGTGPVPVEDPRLFSPTAPLDTALRAAAPATQRATSADSGTNVQEQGVDEPDVVKTDGELLVRLDHGVLTTYDVRGGDAPLALGRIVLDGITGGELLLAGDTATVVAARADGTTRVVGVDLADPAAPVVGATSDLDARLLEARLHGSTVRVVVATGLPELRFVHPGRHRSAAVATQVNADLVRATTLDDWLPDELAGCDQVAIPDERAGVGTAVLVGFDGSDAAGPGERSVQGVLAAADIAYLSADHLYLAAGHGGGSCCVDPFDPPSYDDALAGTTTLHDLELDEVGTGATYVASGRVDGHVGDRWAMDEHDGVLRLAVGASELTADASSVVTLAQDGPSLVEVGRVDDLGRHEQIQSVRWFDGLAILVTYRQVDPLYAVDLTDDRAPRLLGELTIPGFSEYLHPLGEMRMIGVGQGPTSTRRGWGAQVGLFDVTDLTRPRRLDVLSYGGGTQALAGTDPRQLTWLPDSRTVLTVVADWRDRTGYVSVLRLGDGRVENRMVEVEHGSDVDEVRTVPLPDGRVVLVTGSAVSYFEA